MSGYSDLEGLITFVLEKAGIEPDEEDVQEIATAAIRHYRGGTIEIPNYKSTLRNEDLLAEYRRRIDAGGHPDRVLRELSREYFLTPKYTAELIRSTRFNTPSLFAS